MADDFGKICRRRHRGFRQARPDELARLPFVDRDLVTDFRLAAAVAGGNMIKLFSLPPTTKPNKLERFSPL